MLLLTAMALTILAACSRASLDEPDAQSEVVRLVIKVGINTPDGSLERGISRAYPEGEYPAGYEYGFEPAATVYEGINTMRVIVVNSQGIIEGNAIMNFADHIPEADDLYGDFTFHVKGGDTKRVYIIANEASVSTSVVDWKGYAPGTSLSPAEAESMVCHAAGTGDALAYIDNETGSTPRYIPMSEFFDVYVRDADTEEDLTQSARLFITRQLVKFAFTVNSSPSQDGSALNRESFRITEITVSGMSRSGYLFPNATEYLPAKSILAGAGGNRRIITTYRCPDDAGGESFTFRPDNLGLNLNGATTHNVAYAPQLYFQESPVPAGGSYTVTVKVKPDSDTDQKEVTYGPVALPNLPSLPRNTFVKVDFSFKGYDLNCEVVLMPYIGVWLNPIFGLDTQ